MQFILAGDLAGDLDLKSFQSKNNKFPNRNYITMCQ